MLKQLIFKEFVTWHLTPSRLSITSGQDIEKWKGTYFFCLHSFQTVLLFSFLLLFCFCVVVWLVGSFFGVWFFCLFFGGWGVGGNKEETKKKKTAPEQTLRRQALKEWTNLVSPLNDLKRDRQQYWSACPCCCLNHSDCTSPRASKTQKLTINPKLAQNRFFFNYLKH